MIPETYGQWHHCITQECGIPLTAEFIAERQAAWNDETREDTRRFRRVYGDAHWQRIKAWFERAAQEIQAAVDSD